MRRQLDQLLLKPLEEIDATWIATSTTTEGLSQAFLRRFPIKRVTALPTDQEKANFLARALRDRKVNVQNNEAISTLASRANTISDCESMVNNLQYCNVPPAALTMQLLKSLTF